MKTQINPGPCVDFTALREDQIYMEDFIKNYDQVEEERRKFNDYLRYNKEEKLKPLNSEPEIINMQALLSLFAKLPGNPCDVQIRGLRVIFGLKDDKIIFFFSPVVMTRDAEPDTPANVAYTIHSTYGIYIPESGGFSTVDPEYFKTCTDRYFNDVWMQRYRKPTFYTLLSNGDWDSDTLEVIFSFQEIFHLYHMVYPCHAESVYDKDLYFYNGVSNYRNSILNRWRRKHTIFITLEDIDEMEKDDLHALSAINQAANLAHLCPPNCSPVYRITAVYPCP